MEDLFVAAERIDQVPDRFVELTAVQRNVLPIAAALALRDVLCCAAERATVVTGDGLAAPAPRLLEPCGDTSLAAALVAVLRCQPQIVFLLSDGYENAPCGRVAEVVQRARQMGVRIPIYQACPVFAAEARGVRSLCDLVPVMPIGGPQTFGLFVIKQLFDEDPQRGLRALLGTTRAAFASNRVTGVRRERELDGVTRSRLSE